MCSVWSSTILTYAHRTHSRNIKKYTEHQQQQRTHIRFVVSLLACAHFVRWEAWIHHYVKISTITCTQTYWYISTRRRSSCDWTHAQTHTHQYEQENIHQVSEKYTNVKSAKTSTDTPKKKEEKYKIIKTWSTLRCENNELLVWDF